MDIVTFIFPDRLDSGRVGRIRTSWIKGKSLQQYLHEPVMKAQDLIGFSLRCKIYNRKKELVRLYYVPVAGDFIVFNPARST